MTQSRIFKLGPAALAAAAGLSLFVGAAPVIAQVGLDRYDRNITHDRAGKERLHDAAVFESLWRQEPEIQGDAYRSAQVFAKCAESTNESQLAKALATVPGSAKESDAFEKLLQRSKACALGGTTVPTQYLRGALAEQLMFDDDTSQIKPLDMSVQASEVQAFYASDMSASAGDDLNAKLHKIAACHAALAPGLSRNVFETKPGTAEEGEALDKLFKGEFRCGINEFPEGLSVVMQRALLADMVYQWGEFREAKGG